VEHFQGGRYANHGLGRGFALGLGLANIGSGKGTHPRPVAKKGSKTLSALQ
jgi:hypothetical protein